MTPRDGHRAARAAYTATYAAQVNALYTAVDDAAHVVAHLTLTAISDSAREGQKEEV